jgi:hypothetical protein
MSKRGSQKKRSRESAKYEAAQTYVPPTTPSGRPAAGYQCTRGNCGAPLAPIFAPASQPLADWTVSCGKALQVAVVQALCAEGWLLVAWIWGR